MSEILCIFFHGIGRLLLDMKRIISKVIDGKLMLDYN